MLQYDKAYFLLVLSMYEYKLLRHTLKKRLLLLIQMHKGLLLKHIIMEKKVLIIEDNADLQEIMAKHKVAADKLNQRF